MRNTNLVAGIIVIVIVIVVFFLIRSRLPQLRLPTRPSPSPISMPSRPSVTNSEYTITVSTHTPSSKVVIDVVTLKKPGFVAVAENDNGKPGTVLGVSQLLQPGTHQNIVIDLSRKTANGQSLLAVVYNDNGDGKFDLASDEVVKNTKGTAVQSAFTVSSQTSGFQIPATGLGEDDK